jgi:uncharacterized delta-60 repeat protein
MHSKLGCSAVSTLFAALVLTACGGGGGGGASASPPAAGSLDTSFGTGGKVTTPIGNSSDYAYAIALQPDGKIVVAGASSNGSNDDFALARYNPDGSLDTTFDGDGKVTTAVGSGGDVAYAVALQADGKIVVAGSSHNGSNLDFAIARYKANGLLDTSFGASELCPPPPGLCTLIPGTGIVTTAVGGSHDGAYAIALQPDGKIVVAGFSDIGGNNDFALARYNPNGSLDTTFHTDGKVTTAVGINLDSARAIALQADGKIVVAGFSDIGGNYNFALARYNPDGNLDTAFGGDGKVTTAVGGDNGAYAIALQPDGKIVAAGYSFVTNNDFALARYNPDDGSLDTSFDTDGIVTTAVGGSHDFARAITLQPDGKIVVAGYSNIGGNSNFALARYNPNGSLDMSFDGDGKVTTVVGGGSDDGAYAIALQPDGKIVAVGPSEISANIDFALVRYHP